MNGPPDSQSEPEHDNANAAFRRMSLGTVLSRAASLRCPRCGGGKLFSGLFRMYRDCPNCKLHYEQAPGYFLGATYINYGVTAVILTASYIGLHFISGIDNRTLLWPLLAFVVLFPLLSFRYARSFWLALDFFLDPPEIEENP